MQFYVDMDAGTSINGWLVPDNPSDVPHFIVRVPGRADIAMDANVLRSDLRDLGMHATGLAGFLVDDQHVPDIQDVVDITLIEATSGLPIYRRLDPERHLERKFLLMEVGLFPQIKMLRRIMGYFALSYPVVDRLPIETISALIANKEARSIFVTGQPNWTRHGSLVREREYFSAALLRDPFEDLAERLLLIAHLARQPERASRNPSLDKFTDILPIVGDMDFSSDKSVLTGFRKMSPEDRRLFRSPMTFTFGSAPEAELQRRNVSVALDNLAQFDVVGVRPCFEDFVSMVDEGLGVRVLEGSTLDTLPGTWELAAVLSGLGLVADLLDEDIALYSFACEAVETGLGIAGEQERTATPTGGRA